MLESQGVVTIKNDYQDIINAIAKVIYLDLLGWVFSPSLLRVRSFVSVCLQFELSRKSALRDDPNDGCEEEYTQQSYLLFST